MQTQTKLPKCFFDYNDPYVINQSYCMYEFVCVCAGSGTGSGKVLQRFPEKDWDDCPFTIGLELVSYMIMMFLSLFFTRLPTKG